MFFFKYKTYLLRVSIKNYIINQLKPLSTTFEAIITKTIAFITTNLYLNTKKTLNNN